ncbi:hypothetical protein N7468_006484 [Penicillium chermesinum]|uniref:Uncharacterized protein n=1 Tax=Penicillium chermesinum TaxID=63820 RepID=A0A9W9TJW4_9EURO|nr:uncharacterized protein N7468_006484 [Penicillium chermesinum]KAJ5225259.1 hypothetical protein N7468_006484 [Penicillium chermesinum]
MSGIVTRPLSVFRRPDSSKPLHARWGDVGISVPTEGSWNQIDNPHRRALEERQRYGPGFVPGCVSPIRDTSLVKDEGEEDEEEEADEKEQRREIADKPLPRLPKRLPTLGRSNSLQPGRLSVRLASRPKNMNGEPKTEQEVYLEKSKKSDFTYKPIQQDYTAEATEISKRGYTQNSPSQPVCRALPVLRWKARLIHRTAWGKRHQHGPSIPPQSPLQNEALGKKASEEAFYSPQKDRSTSSSPSAAYEMPPRRRTSPFVAADRKRSSLVRPMTLTMVPDSEELY